ncbi:MAG TPA: S8 family serine peptidase, partial [Abditibacteriaceae bacterium]|nr:S8 family serine peptidase [Abditibacteriaceae bacterium]
MTVNPSCRSLSVICRAVLGTLLLTGLWCPLKVSYAQAADGAPPAPAFFYSGGKKHLLTPSTRWSVVELEPGVSASALEQQAVGTLAIDSTRRALRYTKKNIVVLPLAVSAARAPQQARAQSEKLPGAKRTLRAFGDGPAPIIETDDILVRFKPAVSPARIKALLAPYRATVVQPLGRYAPNGFLLRVPNVPRFSAIEVANALYESPEVIFAHPDFIWPLRKRIEPNDPFFAQQWHLFNVAQGGGTVGADIKAPAAWDITRGSPDITVAVIDDGVDTAHPEFQGKLVPGYDFVDNDSDPRPGIYDHHGTACAGLAVGNGSNRVGISGVAPRCSLMPIRLVEPGVLVSAQADAFRFAADQGADVISNSWGPADGEGYQTLPDAVGEAIKYAVTTGRGGKGCVIFFAAGNGNESVDLDGYAANPDVFSVAASDNFDKRARYSDHGTSLDLCAPSDGGTLGVTTTDRSGIYGFSSNGYFNYFGGTSAACPIAAGVAALMLSVNPNLTYLQVRQFLKSTADKIDGSGSGRDRNGNVFSYAYDSAGRSKAYGYGRINALRALQAVLGVTLISPPSDSTATGSTYFLSAVTTKSMPLVQSVEFARRPAPAGFSRSPNLLINDNSTVSDAQVVAGTGTVGEAVLSLHIQHTFIGDLGVKLYAPDGSSVVLHKADGIAESGNPGALIYTDRSLPWLMGRPIAGTWRLEVSENFAIDSGRLISWSLQLWQRWTRIARDTNGPAMGGVYKGRWTGIWDTVSTPPGVYEIRARAITANAVVQDVHTN